MINVLWLEDDKDIISTVSTVLEELDKQDSIHFKIKENFDAAKPILETTDFDVIVLDLREGTDDSKGLTFFQTEVWPKNFCPVIFYSGSELSQDVLNSPELKHRLVHRLVKGVHQVPDLIAKIEQAYSQVEFSQKLVKDLKQAKAHTLREFFEVCGQNYDDTKLKTIAESTLNRRVAALIDYNVHKDNKELEPLEMYIWPPLSGTSLMTGDVLKKIDTGDDYIILTPSCDMVRTDSRTPKVESVLVASCAPIREFLESDSSFSNQSSASKFSDSMKKRLRLTCENGKIIFPQIFDIIPPFYVDLKKLHTIPITQLEDNSQFKRLVSLDSPFRENFVWGVISELGRPGLPDRNLQSWVNDIWSKHPRNANNNTNG